MPHFESRNSKCVQVLKMSLLNPMNSTSEAPGVLKLTKGILVWKNGRMRTAIIDPEQQNFWHPALKSFSCDNSFKHYRLWWLS